MFFDAHHVIVIKWPSDSSVAIVTYRVLVSSLAIEWSFIHIFQNLDDRSSPHRNATFFSATNRSPKSIIAWIAAEIHLQLLLLLTHGLFISYVLLLAKFSFENSVHMPHWVHEQLACDEFIIWLIYGIRQLEVSSLIREDAAAAWLLKFGFLRIPGKSGWLSWLQNAIAKHPLVSSSSSMIPSLILIRVLLLYEFIFFLLAVAREMIMMFSLDGESHQESE